MCPGGRFPRGLHASSAMGRGEASLESRRRRWPRAAAISAAPCGSSVRRPSSRLTAPAAIGAIGARARGTSAAPACEDVGDRRAGADLGGGGDCDHEEDDAGASDRRTSRRGAASTEPPHAPQRSGSVHVAPLAASAARSCSARAIAWAGSRYRSTVRASGTSLLPQVAALMLPARDPERRGRAAARSRGRAGWCRAVCGLARAPGGRVPPGAQLPSRAPRRGRVSSSAAASATCPGLRTSPRSARPSR